MGLKITIRLVTGAICLALITGTLRRFEARHTIATSP
jgi:hypothetical protein